MKTALEIFGKCDDYFDNYQPMLKEFGEIAVQVDDVGYEGDSRILYKKGTKYGWLQFGWGSCCGCDALQACETIQDVQLLMDELYNSIIWFDTANECLEFFTTHNWETDYSYSCEEQKEFVKKVCIFLSNK